LASKTTERDSLVENLHSLREQASEMGHRARETQERCEALEEELSEAHKLLGERGRETDTLRRLLDEAEGREEGRIKRMREKVEAAVEEKERIEEELALVKRTVVRGEGEQTRNLREWEGSVKELRGKYEEARRLVQELMGQKGAAEETVKELRVEAEIARSKAAGFSKFLVRTHAGSADSTGGHESTNPTDTGRAKSVQGSSRRVPITSRPTPTRPQSKPPKPPLSVH
jgi:chromosome segregation ATPase